MQLNFDNFNFQIKTENNQNYIWDIVRKKHCVLTPEEYVRQHCIHQLVKNGYAVSRISIEHSFPNSSKRYDIIYFDELGVPTLLIECKAPHVTLSQQVLEQVSGYVELLNVPNILITNGINHYSFSRKDKNITITQEFPVNAKNSD